MINFIKKIFSIKLKSIEPRLATGTISAIIGIFFSFLELATGFPLLSKYKFFIIVIVIIQVIICYPKFNKKYDPEDNDNTKVFIFLLFLLILFLL